jgi:hypothetical protein
MNEQQKRLAEEVATSEVWYFIFSLRLGWGHYIANARIWEEVQKRGWSLDACGDCARAEDVFSALGLSFPKDERTAGSLVRHVPNRKAIEELAHGLEKTIEFYSHNTQGAYGSHIVFLFRVPLRLYIAKILAP